MTAPAPYLWFPGNAAEAMHFYKDTFGGSLELHTLADFARTDGPPDAIAFGQLSGRVTLFGSDAIGDDQPLQMIGVSIALLGTADGATLTEWFDRLAEDGTVIDPLAERGWGATDGQVADRFGVRWLIGYEDDVNLDA